MEIRRIILLASSFIALLFLVSCKTTGQAVSLGQNELFAVERIAASSGIVTLELPSSALLLDSHEIIIIAEQAPQGTSIVPNSETPQADFKTSNTLVWFFSKTQDEPIGKFTIIKRLPSSITYSVQGTPSAGSVFKGKWGLKIANAEGQIISSGTMATSSTCTDSDGGLVYTSAGSATDGTNTFSDTCATMISGVYQEAASCSGSSCGISEAYCAGNSVHLFVPSGGPGPAFVPCLSGCINGACTAAGTQTTSTGPLSQFYVDNDNDLDGNDLLLAYNLFLSGSSLNGNAVDGIFLLQMYHAWLSQS
ncbi:hypothetical protein HYU14_07635 [Candidatus Woesearchaeota archaeon]|nr:hypothetical protein [Candidatus Woesearchaeota archaeon]